MRRSEAELQASASQELMPPLLGVMAVEAHREIQAGVDTHGLPKPTILQDRVRKIMCRSLITSGYSEPQLVLPPFA